MNELATVEVPSEESALSNMQRAEKVAAVCKAMIQSTAVDIQGKKYPPVECWQAIANAHGCVLSAKDVERVEGGYRATGEVRKASTGELISQAEGFVGDDEKTWANRAEYAKRAMAQTRAMSRAGRSAFAYIAVLARIEGLKTTPAEEVPHGGFDDQPPPKQPQRKSAAPAQQPPVQEEPGANDGLDEPTLVGVPSKFAEKPTSNGGTRYGIMIGGKWGNTFDKAIKDFCATAAAKNASVSAFCVDKGKFGLEIVDVRSA